MKANKKNGIVPLYRKRNTHKRWDPDDDGREYRHGRHTKKAAKQLEDEVKRGPMNGGDYNGYGYDYSPLFQYLLKHVGDDVDEVFSDASKRLTPFGIELFNHMVSRKPKEELSDSFYCGESRRYSQLYVDENNKIQKVNPNLGNVCTSYGGQWGESFNGHPLSLAGHFNRPRLQHG